MQLSEGVIGYCRRVVEKSLIMEQDDRDWPLPDYSGKQELEIVWKGHHVSFLTNHMTSKVEMARSGHDGLLVFHNCVQDLKTMFQQLHSVHFKVKPI